MKLLLATLLLLGRAQPAQCVEVGMMYEGWHAPAYFGRNPGTNATVEGVIRSNGTLPLSVVLPTSPKAQGFWFHKQPAGGFYCIYRKRSTENTSSAGLPDCPGITETLTRHAKLLTAAGVDFIVADSTNLQNTGGFADAIQLRPWEVLAEEWLALRKKGVATPAIAIWQNLQDPTGSLWEKYINGAYSNPAYADLLFKDEKTGKKVFFTTANPTAALVQKIEASGEIVVVTMWALHDGYARGEWSFMAPCTQSGSRSTSVYSDLAKPCAQKLTTNSPIGKHGTSLTVGPSYQLSYSSLPFRAAGKLSGLTLKKSFERAFAENAKGQLDYLMVGTFNEHIAQPQHNPFSAKQAWAKRVGSTYEPVQNQNIDPSPLSIRAGGLAYSQPVSQVQQHPYDGGQEWVKSMGVEDDALAGKLWVDMFGDGLTRDLEPTVEDGGRMWDLFSSCMRVFKSGAARCSASNSNEQCCMFGKLDPYSEWKGVYSLHLNDIEDQLLTTDASERAALKKSGWAEVCSAAGGAAQFCYWKGDINAVAPTAADYTGGPFLLRGLPLPASHPTQAVYRCLSNETRHFISCDPACRGLGKPESVLGYTSLVRDSDTPRALRLCRTTSSRYWPNGRLYYSLDAKCAQIAEHLGFVH
jgi:hypothetical protein